MTQEHMFWCCMLLFDKFAQMLSVVDFIAFSNIGYCLCKPIIGFMTVSLDNQCSVHNPTTLYQSAIVTMGLSGIFPR